MREMEERKKAKRQKFRFIFSPRSPISMDSLRLFLAAPGNIPVHVCSRCDWECFGKGIMILATLGSNHCHAELGRPFLRVPVSKRVRASNQRE